MQKPRYLLPSNGAFVLATSYSRTTYRRTTIGAAAFHFRVRNGNGWGHCAMITRGLTPQLQIEDFRLQIGIRNVLPQRASEFLTISVVNVSKEPFQIVNLRSEIFNSPIL
jgi:hypothetical protein